MINELKAYIKEVCGCNISIYKWEKSEKLALFLQETYDFFQTEILSCPCILLKPKNDDLSVEQIKKHLNKIQIFTDAKLVIIDKRMTNYLKARFLENRIPFIILDRQMYLPFICLDIKNTTYKKDKVKKFTPSTQMVYLYFLYNNSVINATELSEILGVSLMTVSRALNDLYDLNLLTYDLGGKTNRSKKYNRIASRDYYYLAKEFLQSPIKKLVYTKDDLEDSTYAGLSALSNLSMINGENYNVYAIDKADLDKIAVVEIEDKAMIEEENLNIVELWSYNPKLFTDTENVDLLSLYLSLKDERDYRVQDGLKELLRSTKWYMD